MSDLTNPSDSAGIPQDRVYTFEWRRKEHARVTELLMKERFGSGPFRLLRVAILFVAIVSCVIAVAGIVAGDSEMVIPLLPLAVTVGFLTLAFSRITGSLQAWQVGRTDPNTSHPITFRFADSGLQISMHTVDAELRWTGVPRVRESDDLFLIHYSRRRAYFLPKRAVPSAQKVADLSDWIRAQLPSNSEYVRDPF